MHAQDNLLKQKSLLFIDNVDSFTYNLVHYFQLLGIQTCVVRNHQITPQECLRLQPDYLVIGPGPGTPSNAGISKAVIEVCAGKIPILGVCLGHQAIAEVYGGEVIRAENPMHGKQSKICHNNRGVFYQLPQEFLATRYHSLIVKKESLPPCLEVTAQTSEGEIMGLRHKTYSVEGVQFHPESVLTEQGLALLTNFLDKGSV